MESIFYVVGHLAMYAFVGSIIWGIVAALNDSLKYREPPSKRR